MGAVPLQPHGTRGERALSGFAALELVALLVALVGLILAALL